MGGVVWLASYPKSGNTWTRNFLHSLLSSEQADGDDITTADINKMQKKTVWDSGFRWYEPYLAGKKSFSDCSNEEMAKVRMQANENMAKQAKDGLVLVKTHNALVTDYGGIPLINLQITAGAVYIIRNPLDVAVSYKHHLNASLNKTIEVMATKGKCIPASEKMAYELHGSWSEHVASWTFKSNPALHIMRYEDMLADPNKAFTELTAFLQIEASQTQIAQAVEASSFDKLKQQEQAASFSEKPKDAKEFFRKGTSGDWRNVLSKRQVQEIIAAHGEQMERFGYLPEQL